MLKKIFIRNETYLNELRTPIVPSHIYKLINYGFIVYIQSSNCRCYKDEEYIGAIIVYDDWVNYNDCLIIGIKELNNIDKLNCHTHIYFSHSFKNQFNSQYILNSFKKSNSILYDLEYFKENNKRLIAFGYYAGIVGGALGLMNYNKRLKSLKHWDSISNLISDIPNVNCKIAIIGSNGRCGLGVKYILDLLNINYVEFNRESNKNELIHFNIIYNCIHLTENIGIWFDNNTNFYNKMTIVDISCDYNNKYNPIKLYNNKTTWSNPVYIYNECVDIIAIDNLPSLLPKESSNNFSEKLTDILLTYFDDNKRYWINNFIHYAKHLEQLDT